jgi:glycosyltransferase involved in cell wall biosynthesis
MDGHFWKWRMQGGAIELARQAEARLASGERPDVLLATSMVNLPAFLALLRKQRALHAAPVVLYMHENQLTYPPPPGSKRDLTYSMIQHLSMLAADQICFNSAYHLASWYRELPRLLKHFPDYIHLESLGATRARARVLPVGCNLHRLDAYRSTAVASEPGRTGAVPLILWNQRWEYDKDPATMLQALYALADEGLAFRVALAGENFRVLPAEFAQAQARLGARLIHYGYAADAASYARLLWSSDIVLSTALHEFFGVSVVEALYCGCWPILPRRLSYPELIPPALHAGCLYDDFGGLLDRLRTAVLQYCAATPGPAAQTAATSQGLLREAAARFDWRVQAPRYDALLAGVAANRNF